MGFCCSGDRLPLRFWLEADLGGPDLEAGFGQKPSGEERRSRSAVLVLFSLSDAYSVCVHRCAHGPEARGQLAQDLQAR